jgi:hypothetical protein
MSLGDAKSAVHFSATWADHRQDREAFWAEAEAAFEEMAVTGTTAQGMADASDEPKQP